MRALGLAGLLAVLCSAPARADWRIEGQPLPDWIQRETGTASHLDAVCEDLAVEIMLSGRSRANFANVWLDNAGDEPVTLLADSVTVRFSDGRVRRLLPITAGDSITRPGFITGTVFQFPDKRDFAGQSALSIEALVLRGRDRCVLRSAFRRDERIPESPFTTTVHQRFTLDLSLGSTFAHHGAIGRLTPPASFLFGFGGTVVPWVHHGFTLEVLVDEWGKRGVPAVSPTSPSNTSLAAAIILVGYAHRRYPLPWLVTSIEAAAGVYAVQLSDGSKALQTSDPRLAGRGRLRLQVPFLQSWFAGLALDYNRFVGGSLGGARLGGGTLGAVVLAGFGE